MTMPLTMTDPAPPPRLAERQAGAVAVQTDGASTGDAGFAETLAGAMEGGTPALIGQAGPLIAGDAAEPAAPDAGAILDTLGAQAAVTEAGLATGEATPGAALSMTEPSVGDAGEMAVPDAEAATAALDGTEAPELAEDGEAAAGTEAAAVPLGMLLAAALPGLATQKSEGQAGPAKAPDASVEAARRAMQAAVLLPGATKGDKAAKPALRMAAGEATGKDVSALGEAGAAKGEKDAADPRAGVTAGGAAAGVPVSGIALPGSTDARREASAQALTEALKPVPGQAAPAADPGAGLAQGGAMPGATPQAGPMPGTALAMERPGWEAALVERITAEMSDDGQEIELELAPERLGQLRIRLEVIDGQAQVRFVTETTEAARLFQQNEHRLSESLTRAGLSLGGHDSTSRDAPGQGRDDRSERGMRATGMILERTDPSRPGAAMLRPGQGLVNLIA